MAIEKFDLTSLAKLDGERIKVAFDRLLRQCEADCRDRPGVAAARKVVLAIEMKPVQADNSLLESVDVKVVLDTAIPKKQSRSYNMRAERGGLLFNEASPEDVRQRTLDMAPRPEPVEEDEDVTVTEDEEEATDAC